MKEYIHDDSDLILEQLEFDGYALESESESDLESDSDPKTNIGLNIQENNNKKSLFENYKLICLKDM